MTAIGERAARKAEAADRKRQYPYEVVCECNGQEIVFGDSEAGDGGSAMFLAKLTPWAKNPRVRRKP